MKALIGAFASVAMVGAASAQVTAINVNTRTGTSSGGTDVVVNEISLDFTGLFTGIQILSELTSGEVINFAPFGPNNNAPNPGLVGADPDLDLDTFFANGTLRQNANGDLGLGGGAVNIGGAAEAAAVWNDAVKISQAVNPAGGADIQGSPGFVVAQISFSPDANGSFDLFAAPVVNDVDQNFLASADTPFGGFIVENGAIVEVPEPATAALLGLGGLAMLRRRA